MGVRTANVQDGNIGQTMEGLVATIHGRREASPETSYTAKLLQGEEDSLLKKVIEEAGEVVMACKDNDHDHIRYEAGDLVYHLLVVLERYGVTIDELAGELNARMKKGDGALPHLLGQVARSCRARERASGEGVLALCQITR